MDKSKALLEPFRQECRVMLGVLGKPFFLRRCKDDDHLFVSDLPRRTPHAALAVILLSLESSGFVGTIVPEENLLYIDATLARYESLLEDLPNATDTLVLPHDDALHPAYALCRLLLHHPAPLHQQPLAPLRRVLKWTQAEPASSLPADPASPWPPATVSSTAGGMKPASTRLFVQIIRLHQECASRLRLRQPLPYAAGRVLAFWLTATDTPTYPNMPVNYLQNRLTFQS